MNKTEEKVLQEGESNFQKSNNRVIVWSWNTKNQIINFHGCGTYVGRADVENENGEKTQRFKFEMDNGVQMLSGPNCWYLPKGEHQLKEKSMEDIKETVIGAPRLMLDTWTFVDCRPKSQKPKEKS